MNARSVASGIVAQDVKRLRLAVSAPALAPHVRLIGPMPASGFQEPQALVEVGGNFVQISELLYRILEQMDGRRGAEEIAERATESTEWAITADQVEYLITTKLAPMGIFCGSDEGREKTRDKTARSPLAVNFRMRTVGPGLIDPIARILQLFFWTPVLVILLAAISAAHFWLYRVHGVEKSLEATLGTPGGLPLVIAVVILSAVFHEFGHAAALRFGGGRVRGMGVGLYIVYPAFYTDVTEAYRLSRQARIRTDLGGVYFNGISCLILMAISRLAGIESLLFAVVLINLEMMRQFIPLVRLDGYWLLADLTGIPDLFSQLQPFLRSLTPALRATGPALPRLRTWVRIVFGIYILAVVPMLAYFGFLMLRNLPSFLERTCTALWHQSFALIAAVRGHEIGVAVLLGVTVLLLTASIVGTFYIIVTMIRPLKTAWCWTRFRPVWRMGFPAAMALTAGVFGFLWRGPVTRIYTEMAASYGEWTTPASATRAERLLRAAAAATAGTSSLTADLEGRFGSDPFTGAVALKRPNLIHMAVRSPGGLGHFTVISDGQRLSTIFPGDNRYATSLPGTDGANIRVYVADQVEYFFRPGVVSEMLRTGTVSYAGPLRTGGGTYELIDYFSRGAPRRGVRLFIEPGHNLIEGIYARTEYPDGKFDESWALMKHVQTGIKIDAAQFSWRVPERSEPLFFPPGVQLPISGAQGHHTQ
jgi:hypothetical protein